MAYGDFKDLAKRTPSDKVLRDVASMVYKFFAKKSKAVVLNLGQINNLQVNFINQLLNNLREKRYIHHLSTIFGVLI